MAGCLRLRAGSARAGLGLCVATLVALFWAEPVLAATPAFRGPLYDRRPSGPEDWREPRVVVECGGEISVYNTREPQIEVFLPDRKASGGAAVVMLPGGGLRLLGLGAQSDAEVDAFLRQGVAVVRLEYRTAQVSGSEIPRTCRASSTGAPPVQFPKLAIQKANANPAPQDATLTLVLGLAVADGQEAMRFAHRMVPSWGVDPKRIGVIGISAGGGVAVGMVRADAPPDAKPAFLVSIFGPSLQDVDVPKDAPPLFIVTEADHGPVTQGLLAVFSLWKDAGKPAEIHVFDVPAFSMTVDLWSGRMFAWLQAKGFLSGLRDPIDKVAR